ncbi:hypothetical protein RDWZM_000847 [Blomia tropicalis]|uniref:Equilibrative nucleoside transporter 1 n=1 Tax=Blomia tropicalis TaxID=40697 RepID=A0A9Q0MDL5_BLOTA|nr:hypothetical protein RDWZM_000847 [Blomia tropicalis]
MVNFSNLKSAIPTDRWNFIYIIFLINGIGSLLPWNMLINADNYFVNYKLNITNPTSMQDNYRQHFLSYLGLFSKGPNILLQILNVFINAENANLTRRINITLVIQIVVFLIIIAMAAIDSSGWPDLFFWLTMMSAAFINLANGVFQSCLYGIAGRFPMKYTNSVTIGMNLSGTLASLLMLISIAVSPSYQVEAIVFFSFAIALLIVCLLAGFYVSTNKFHQYYSNKNLIRTPSISSINMELSNGHHKGRSSSLLHNAIISTVTYDGKPLNSTCKDFQSSAKAKYVYVLKRIWVQLINVMLIYMVSLSIFPALSARILSEDGILDENYFAPVFCFLFFNLFATVGNTIAQHVQWPGPKYLIIFTIGRLMFIPFFLYCNYHPGDARTLPIIFHRDWMYICGMIAMATSSGYLSSLSLMYIPKCVHPDVSATAAMFAVLTVMLGILVGINLSIFYPTIVTS